MKWTACLIVVVAVASATAQVSSNQTQTSQTTQTPEVPPAFPYFNPLAQMTGDLAAQLQFSQVFGKFLLDFQSAQGWMQVAQGWVAMSSIEQRIAPNGAVSFEESEDLEEDDHPGAPDYDNIERQSEFALLHVLKIMYLQAAQKLHETKNMNFEAKIRLNALAATGVAPQIVYLGYYAEALRTMSSGISIQRQDAWNTWLLHEIMETDEFDNSHNLAAVPTSFLDTMAGSREIAMSLYYQEASLDLQVLMMDYYVNAAYMQLVAAATGAAGVQGTSFVEEEATAEPSKPFFAPGVGMGNYISLYVMYLKYFTVIMNFQAAQGLYMHAHLEASKDTQNLHYASSMKLGACSALQQWAFLKYQTVMLQVYGLFMGVPPQANNAAATSNSLLQTGSSTQQ